MNKTIELHRAAPAKPAVGSSCNGCGVCCALTPCPLSRFLLGHRTGVCPALTWQPETSAYGCGLVLAPERHLKWLPEFCVPLARSLALRWIAAGFGCDCDAELE